MRWPLLTAAVTAGLYLSGLFEPLELMTQDVRFLLRGYKTESSDVVVVGITQACINRYGPLPWPRSRYGEIIRRLKENGARVVCLDLFFPLPTEPEEDATLERAIREAGNVVLPVFCPVALHRFPKGPVRKVDVLRENLPVFSRAACGMGHINVPPSVDRKCRGVPYALEYKRHVYYALSIEAAAQFAARRNGRRTVPVIPQPPLTPDGEFLINFHGQRAVIPIRTASEVLQGKFPPDAFKDRVVLIGQTALGQINADLITTPLGQMFGVLVQATAIDNLLKNQVLTREGPGAALTVVVLLSLLSTALYRRTSPLLAISIFLVSLAGVCSVALGMFLYQNYMMNVTEPAAVLALNLAIALVVKTLESRRAAREREFELSAIVDTGRLSIQPSDPEVVPEALVELVGGTVGVDVASLFLLHGRETWYWLPPQPAAEDSLLASDVPAIRDFEVAASDFLMGQTPFFMTGDVRTDSAIPVTPEFSTKSFLCVPLAVRDESIGFVCFYNKRPSRVAPRDAFTEEDIRLAWVLCREAALILDNQRLVADLREKNVRLRQAMEELRQTQAKVVQAEKLSAVGRMAAMIVHDIRNALTTVSGVTELMQQSVAPQFSDLLDSAQRRISDIREMAQEILDYTREETVLELTEIIPAHLIADVLKQLGEAFPEEEIRWVSEITCNEPFVGDYLKLSRVFFNLGRNAAEAMGGRGIFRLGCRSWDGGIEFTAADTGPGIPEGIQDTIFEPFVTYGKERGTGLGLAMVQKTVEDHGGRVWFESTRGRGTTFYVRLPWRPPSRSPALIATEDDEY